jgi:hypothetical protein
MRKLFFVLCVLAILPVAVFADSPPPSLISWGIGPAAFYKSPVLLGQPTDTNNLNVDQFIFGGDLRFKVSLFQAEALVLYAGGNGVNSFDTYLDAGLALDIAILRIDLGIGPNFVYNSGNNSGAQVGLNAKVGADVLLGPISVGLSYIMELNISNGVQVGTGSGLLGLNVMFWI